MFFKPILCWKKNICSWIISDFLLCLAKESCKLHNFIIFTDLQDFWRVLGEFEDSFALIAILIYISLLNYTDLCIYKLHAK